MINETFRKFFKLIIVFNMAMAISECQIELIRQFLTACLPGEKFNMVCYFLRIAEI